MSDSTLETIGILVIAAALILAIAVVAMRRRSIRSALLAGALAGFIAAGIGSRVVMRVLALADPDHHGVTTDSSATVGQITFGGTISLLGVGTLLGIIGGLAYLGLRRWLVVPRPWRGLAFGAVTLLTIGNLLFDTHNVDFQIIEPVLLVVALFAVLFLVNGLILASLMDRLHPEPPHPTHPWMQKSVAGIIAVVCALGLTGLVGSVTQMFAESGTCHSAKGGGEGCAVLERDVDP